MKPGLPKAEIHCHIEGAANPALVVEQARKYDVDVSRVHLAGPSLRLARFHFLPAGL